MNIQIVGLTLEFVGSVFIAFTALMIHHRILHEHGVDKVVLTTMKSEQKVGILGVLLLLAGFIFQITAIL